MIHPSYSELTKAINANQEEDEAPVVNSRYSVVLATSKRARQIIGGADPKVPGRGKKPLSIAVEELYKGKVTILPEEESEDEE
ncbi:MAG TPA: DNA-directed RNA polymerase subunit omega [Candidatus Egerieimonas intestinavium]|uniref:DNA-directed RNA polymerase subunit omega n=1 Tax=Candidatus Egerieimonas intestinavium TaxID=2840777 RepID=A0A9D1JFZ8_9FIRM|nr:DNA-directed RNA polymerase subunit omega [Candidatus Egerieimonas intestinavium]